MSVKKYFLRTPRKIFLWDIQEPRWPPGIQDPLHATAEVPQVTVSEGLAQNPYMSRIHTCDPSDEWCTTARAGSELTTLLTKGVESTNERRPTITYLP